MNMSTSHQFITYSNPNPNFDQFFTNFVCDDHQLTKDSPYFQIANFLMSDEVLEERNTATSKRDLDFFDGSAISIPSNSNKKCRRGVKKYKTQEEFRFVFRTKSDLDFMDDGFKWRKYGKKMLKSTPNPRNYFKCTSGGCSVKKRVERDSKDASFVITTYEGIHNHETPSSSTSFNVVHLSPNSTAQQPSSLIYAPSSFSSTNN